MVPKRSILLALGAAVLLSSGCHPWFKSQFPREDKSDPNQGPVITTADRGRSQSGNYEPGTPSYVSLIDTCVSKGGTRAECIESLLPQELGKLEAEEMRRGAMRHRQMQRRHASDQTNAAFGFAVDLPARWRSRVAKPATTTERPTIEYFNPAGPGTLRMRTLLTPVPATRAQLRDLTNIGPEIPLEYENWGEFAGYHFEQVENDVYYRHWWLAGGGSLILITYQCDPDMSEAERAQVDSIINTLRCGELC